MGSPLCDFTTFHDKDHIRILHGRNSLRNNDLGCIRNFFPHRLSDQRIRLSVNRRSRIIQNQDLRLLQKCSCNTQSLFLSTGYVCSALLNLSIIFFRKLLHEFICLCQLTYMQDFFIRCVFFTPAEIFLNRTGKQNVLL